MSNISDDQALEALLSSAQSKEQTRDRNHNHNRGRNTTTTKKRFNDDSTSNHNYRNNDRYGNNNRGGGSGGSGRGGGRGGGGGGRDDYYRPRNDDGRDRDNRNGNDNGNDNGNRSYQNKRQRRFNSRKDEEKEDSKYSWGDNNNNNNDNEEDNNNDNEDTRAQNNVPEEKANFGLSGALQEDETTGNTYNGIVLKFSEPPEARTPNTRWRLYVFKKKSGDDDNDNDDNKKDNGGLLQTLHISKQSAYLFGRERKVADIPVDHPSLSKQHCVLQYRSLPDKNDREQRLRCKPYLMDLGSTNGTFINGVRIEDARYYELRKGDVITLGASTREYVLLTENTTSSDL